jgi:hypothetical protein
MGFLGNLFSGSSGMGWTARGTDIDRPTTSAQAQTAYNQTQQGLQGQQAFLQALQGQGGLGNQSSVFGQQQDLANMMQGVAAGTGPNPALAQLNQTTGQNIAATTAALAGARGAGSNPALMARTAARQGADTQQQAAGQGATLAAQQQIAGMDALSRQQQNMAAMANQQVANQAAATNAYSTSAQNQQQNLLAGINAQNQAMVSQLASQNQANAAIQGQVAGAQKDMLGGLMGGFSQGMGLPFARGGRVPNYADGGDVQRTNLPQIDSPFNLSLGSIDMPQEEKDSETKKGFSKLGESLGSKGKEGLTSAVMGPGFGFAGGGKVPAMVSPGEKYLSPEQAQDVLKGKENPMNGKTIPGKAKVKGDSYANDTVPVTLEEGGCVIPRSVLQSDQPMKNAIKFVHAHMKKMAKGGKVENEKKDQKAEKQPAAESHQVPMAVASEVLKNPHMLFSPANALFKKTLNLTPDQVLELLHSKGIVAEPAMGKYGEVEPSIVVHNVEHHHVPFVLDLAKQLGQESAIMSANGKHEAHYLNGPNEGKVARGMGTVIHGKEPDNFYTKTKNGLIFSHNIDWDNLHDK